MALTTEHVESFLGRGFTRRQVGRIASLLAGGAAFPFYNEYAMAQQAEQQMQRGGGMRRAMGSDVIRISSNENPMGPCKEGVEAIAKVAPMGWRYSPNN